MALNMNLLECVFLKINKFCLGQCIFFKVTITLIIKVNSNGNNSFNGLFFEANISRIKRSIFNAITQYIINCVTPHFWNGLY